MSTSAIHNLFIIITQNEHTFNIFVLYTQTIKDKKGIRKGSKVKIMEATYDVYKVNGNAGTRLNMYHGTRKAEALKVANGCNGYAGRKQCYVEVIQTCDNGTWELTGTRGEYRTKVKEV